MRFLLTPLREGRRLTLEQLEMRVHISTHAPAGGATSGAGANGIARSHFYSRPCGRGDAHGRTYGSFRQISTHAPAGGATPPLPGGPTTYSFLLTPLREGRLLPLQRHAESLAFLLTPLREGRPRRSIGMSPARAISTHAPAGGATNDDFIMLKTNVHFYSRPCGRGDRCHGRRHIKHSHFYSRPCGRGDIRPVPRRILRRRISTHAPAGGATLFLYRADDGVDISTHAPAGGATETEMVEKSKIIVISTHAPAGGATDQTLYQLRQGQISTHAPAGGATKTEKSIAQLINNFYSRPCGRGDRIRCRGRTVLLCHFYSRPCGRGDRAPWPTTARLQNFYSRPCGRGDGNGRGTATHRCRFLLTPLREGRRHRYHRPHRPLRFLLTPLREGRHCCGRAGT